MRTPPIRLALSAVLALTVLACESDRLLKPGAPGTEQAPAADAPPLRITEVMPDPQRVLDDVGEWFEVFNAGEEPVDLNGWEIASGPNDNPPTDRHVINRSLVVPPGGFAVLARNGDPTVNGGLTASYVYGTAITLNNSNTDWLRLKMPDGTLVDTVAYAARVGGVPQPFTPPVGASRAVIDINADRTIIAGPNWRTSTEPYGLGDRGTPGSGPYGDAGPIVRVTVAPSPATVRVGGTRQFTATGFDAEGRASPTTFAWASSDPAVATVSATGLATGISEGTAVITATAENGVQGSATLGVFPPGVPASISISINDPPRAPAGYTKPAFVTVRDADGTVISPPPPLVWSSDHPAIASVDSLGYITGVEPGVVRITATAPNGVSGSASFTVVPGDAPTPAVYRNHLEFGVPNDHTPEDEHLLVKRQYALSYNHVRGGANWVSWNLNATHFGFAPRCDCFTADQTLPAAFYRVVDFDYRNSGYDRGHMVQSESRTTTDQENASTFLMTNILPQASENNQGPWSRFEIYLNDLVRMQGKEVYVMAGGQYLQPTYTLKDEGRVAIPHYTWKIAVILPAGAGLLDVRSPADLEVIVVRTPNLELPNVPGSAIGIMNRPWQDFVTTVDAVEIASGYDFLARLPDDIEDAVESGGPTSAGGENPASLRSTAQRTPALGPSR